MKVLYNQYKKLLLNVIITSHHSNTWWHSPWGLSKWCTSSLFLPCTLYFLSSLEVCTCYFYRFHTIYIYLPQGVHGIVNSLDCGGVNNIYSDSGTKVTLTCNVETSSITWVIEPGNTVLEFTASGDDTGDSELVNGIYNATYVNATPPATSTLAFVLNGSLNGTSITCRDGGFLGNDMTCYILVIGKNMMCLLRFSNTLYLLF